MAVNIKGQDKGQECEVNIVESDDGLHIDIPGHLKIDGMPTYKRGDDGAKDTSRPTGNVTLATTHGFVHLRSGCELTMTLMRRGTGGSKRGKVSVK